MTKAELVTKVAGDSKITKAQAEKAVDGFVAAVSAALAESEKVVAEVLGMPTIAVHEVTTFYNMYNLQPVGKYKIGLIAQERQPHLIEKRCPDEFERVRQERVRKQADIRHRHAIIGEPQAQSVGDR